MAKPSVRALINPALLVWAREALGLSIAEAAERLRVTEERLRKWETLDPPPTIPQLRKAAALYRRPLAFFYLPEPPASRPASPPDFRRGDAIEARTGPALALEMRRARERRQIALDLWRELDEPLPEFSASILLDEAPADAARRIREWVGIPMDEQLRWSNQHAALKAWRSALEARGILVLQFTDVPIREARGFSFSEQPLPVIAVNSKDLAVARIFTMFHELVHLLLRQSGVCDYVGGSRISDAVLLERHCNAVAAEILVPSDALAAADRGVLEFDDVHRRIAEIARRFKVSKEATVLRLIAAGRASWAIWDEVHGRHFREVEENVQKLREHDGGPSPTTRAMANLGSRFLSLLVRAYQAELITGPEFVDYANVRLKRIDEIEGALVRGQ